MNEEVCELIDRPRKTLNIALHAYECLPGLVFVKVPNERGRYMLTDRCVVEVDCPHCKAVSGEPCKSVNMLTTTYTVGTHYRRRCLSSSWRGKAKPKLRVPVMDMVAAMQ